MEQFRTNQSLEGTSGKLEITVVNIQKFAEDKTKVKLDNYAINLQRIFIIDEAHRGYNPKGSFLANLFDADENSIKIALTGTPLLSEERASWKVFGEYFHTYYYDKSIQDGYTLKIIREDIETSYKEKLSEIYEKLETLVRKKDIKKNQIIEHERYVKELLRYIISDLKQFRLIRGDDSLGGMIICETSEQARKLYAYFDEIQKELNQESSNKSKFKAGLILYDSDDKETRKGIIKDFKKNMTVDILIVFNMLLTGFDAPRLKRLYFGRKLKDHNLLQAITRVNRPYKNNKYGFVIDFADIKANFDETNEAYMKELSRFNDPDETGETYATDIFTQVIEDKDALIEQMKEVRQILFNYPVDNLEEFSREISSIESKEELTELKNALIEARDCCNIVRTFGDDELKATFRKLELSKLPEMIQEIQRHLDNIKQKEAFEKDDSVRQLVNDAMQDISFNFKKIDEEEMKLISGGVELQDKWQQTIAAFTANIDQEDPEFITLREAFMKRFKEHGFVVHGIDEFREHQKALDEVMKKLEELKKRNKVLLKRYMDDAKFVRVHKRIFEENIKRKTNGASFIISKFEQDIVDILNTIKRDIDQRVYDKNDILKQDAYFEQTVMQLVMKSLNAQELKAEKDDRVFIQKRVTKQYLEQYKETYKND